MNDDLKYSRRGVSASKEDVHAAIKHTDRGIFPKAFCKIVPDLIGEDPAWCNVMHADGAGTKSSLAYIYWKETGDLSVWKGIAQDAIVMNLDDLLCTGIIGPVLLSSTIGRNRKLIPGEVISAIIEGTEEFLAKMRLHGIGIYSTGGETADVGDLVRTIIVDSTVTARIRRQDVVSNDRISAGDVIVGLSSFGKAVYEDTYNSGMGSNGLTSARHDLLTKTYYKKYPESLDPGMPEAAGFSAARYRAYVRKSFASPDERLYRLVDIATGRVLAFKTHRILDQGEALMLLGGVHPDYKDAGLASISACFQYNSLKEEGVRRITTHVSARNIPTLNIEVSGLQYRIAAVFTIFRKLYD